MDILRLQPHLKEAFESLADALRHFDFEVVMMGGSVLAAKWHHRWSTDIDLFVPEDSLFVEGTSEADLQRRVVGRLLDSGVIGRDAARSAGSNEFGVDAHTVHGTPFSIHPSPYLLASPPDGVISHIPECTRRVDPKPSLGSVEGGPEPDDPIGASGCGMR